MSLFDKLFGCPEPSDPYDPFVTIPPLGCVPPNSQQPGPIQQSYNSYIQQMYNQQQAQQQAQHHAQQMQHYQNALSQMGQAGLVWGTPTPQGYRDFAQFLLKFLQDNDDNVNFFLLALPDELRPIYEELRKSPAGDGE